MEFDKFFDYKEKKVSMMEKCSEASEKLRKNGNKIYISKGHNDNIHRMILALYSKSIAYAPKDSEELALAHSNRSALLLHLHKPDKCMIDIDKALQITKSNDLRVKLLSRKSNCFQLINKSKKSSSKSQSSRNIGQKFENPQFVPSKEIPCAAECIKVHYSEKYGRHLIATRDIKPGEVVMVEEGYAAFSKKHQMYLVCSHCLSFAWNGIPCDFCAFTIYCSEDCKKKAWEEYHDVECSILPFVFCYEQENFNFTHIIIMARIFIMAIKKEGLENILKNAQAINSQQDVGTKGFLFNEMFADCNKFKSFYSLSSHAEVNRNHDNSFGKLILNLLFRHSSILNTYKKNFNGIVMANRTKLLEIEKILLRLLNILDVNAYSYQDCICNCPNISSCGRECVSIKGTFIAPCSSLINHSCNPNISRIFIPKRKIVLYTTNPVKKGEQLCDSYGPVILLNKQERQAYLQRNFYFTCECQACTDEWSTKFLSDPDIDLFMFRKLKPILDKRYSDGKSNSCFLERLDDWIIDEEAIKDAIEMCELIHENFNSQEAYVLGLEYRAFFDKVFHTLYGEKYNMPNQC